MNEMNQIFDTLYFKALEACDKFFTPFPEAMKCVNYVLANFEKMQDLHTIYSKLYTLSSKLKMWNNNSVVLCDFSSYLSFLLLLQSLKKGCFVGNKCVTFF